MMQQQQQQHAAIWYSQKYVANLTQWRISLRMYKFDIRGKFAKNDTIGQENYLNK